MVRSIVPHIAFLAILTCAAPAAAQSEEDKQRANELAAEAVAAFQNSDYTTAAARFAEAHEFYPQASLKLNEMVAWYKADDCASATRVSRWIESNVDGLTSADEKDLDRVTSDCAYREANELFEGGDLTGASAILENIETEDGEVALKVGRLQGKIEERRSARAEVVPPEHEEPVKVVAPPPTWWKPAGFAAVGLGGALLVTSGVKWLVERGTVKQWDDCINSNTPPAVCPTDENGDHYIPEATKKQINRQSLTNIVLAVTGGASLIAGGTFLFLHYQREANRTDESSDGASMSISPTFSPDGAGVVLQLQF